MEKKEESQVITREEIEEVLKSLKEATDNSIKEGFIQNPDELKSDYEEVERYLNSFEGVKRDTVALILATSVPLLSAIAAMGMASLSKKVAVHKTMQSLLKKK